MINNIFLEQDINAGVGWFFNNKRIYISYGNEGGGGVYSEKYKLVVIMNYKKEMYNLDMKAYSLDGKLVSEIKPYEKDSLEYIYITSHGYSKSNVAVVAEYKEYRDGFSQWHFEVDLVNFKITKNISPAY